MKVLYLLNRVQHDRIVAIKQGEENDNPLYGMLRLPKYGVEADYIEIEQYLPKCFATFLREHIFNIYWVHLPLFFKFFSYDVVFSSTSFGSQLLHTIYPFKKPKWIMLDFSLIGLLGKEKTFKQKLVAFIVSRSSGVVTIDACEKTAIEKRFPRLKGKVEFIRYAVDTNFFKLHPEIEEEDFIFSPGRDPGRDFKTLFQAVRGLDTRTILTARSEIIKKLSPLPTEVTNTNFTPKEYIATLAKANIVVIPLDTRRDINNAMGISTLVEAMAAGKAVIATRTPSTESYIDNGRTGLLVSSQDPEALREAIRVLIQNSQLRTKLGNEARAFAMEHCSADGFASSLAEYMKRIILST